MPFGGPPGQDLLLLQTLCAKGHNEAMLPAGETSTTTTVLHSQSPDETRDLAARLAGYLQVGDVVALSGSLGAGKTCFVQGLARGLGIEGYVTSPTFILMRHHPGNPSLCHADAYRLESPEELEDLGLEDVLASAVLALEWAEGVADALPAERIEVHITSDGESTRTLHIEGRGDRLAAVVREAFA